MDDPIVGPIGEEKATTSPEGYPIIRMGAVDVEIQFDGRPEGDSKPTEYKGDPAIESGALIIFRNSGRPILDAHLMIEIHASGRFCFRVTGEDFDTGRYEYQAPCRIYGWIHTDEQFPAVIMPGGRPIRKDRVNPTDIALDQEFATGKQWELYIRFLVPYVPPPEEEGHYNWLLGCNVPPSH